MARRELFPGYLVDFRNAGTYDHSVGGAVSLAGAICPNCAKPLILHMTLDLADPAFHAIAAPQPKLYLLYCMRCDLLSFDFSYRFVGDTIVDIIDVVLGERHWDDWYADGRGDEAPKRGISFRPIPSRLAEL